MKMLKTAALILAAAGPLLPASAAAQDEGVTTIGFTRSVFFGYEGSETTFTVVKHGPAETLIRWATSPDTSTIHSDAATAGDDYAGSSGTLFFAPRDTVQTFTVRTNADDDATEGPEAFLVELFIDDGSDRRTGRAAAVELDDSRSAAAGVIFPWSSPF